MLLSCYLSTATHPAAFSSPGNQQLREGYLDTWLPPTKCAFFHPNKPVPSKTPAPALVVGVPPIGSHRPQVVQVAGSYSKVRSPTVGGRVVLPTQHLLEFWAQKLNKFGKQRFLFGFGGGQKSHPTFLVPTPRKTSQKRLTEQQGLELCPS